MKKIYLILILGMFLLMNVSALESWKGSDEINVNITITQVCNDATYITLNTLQYPNGTTQILNVNMTSTGNGGFQYNQTNNPDFGTYELTGVSDGCENTFAGTYTIGEELSLEFILGLIGIIALFIILGFSFTTKKWKVRSFFFMMAGLLGIILLNSIRIAFRSSSNLNTMMEVSLVVMIIILSFIFLYFFIYALIEVFSYFRKKEKMKWEVSENPY